MKINFCIGNICVGAPKEILVIPEIGINHNGSLEIAKKMVDAAYEAGAVIIKHQTHVVDDEMSHVAQSVKPGNADISIYDVMKNAALSYEDELYLKKYTEERGMIFLSTPFSRAAADRLEKMEVLAYKIGSGELNNYPLVEHIAEFGKPMIVSTGMNNIEAIEVTANILEKKNVPYAFLHTTNIYPTPAHLVRLGGMQELMRRFQDVPIGLSDHTKNNNACIAAMALGASIVERHFTDTKERSGPDIICSMDKKGLKELIEASKEVPLMLGGKKEAAKEEQVTINFAFASVVTIKSIKKGEMFTKDNLWVKRPGTGEIPAVKFDDLLGKKAARDLECDVQLKYSDIE